MEGFICPECRETFQTAGILEAHFNAHFQKASAIKSIVSKAKDYTLSWIGNEEEEAVPSSSSSPPSTYRSTIPEEDQVIGRSNNLSKVFKAVRPKRTSHTQKEINKLLLRLDKLVSALLAEIKLGKKNLKEVERSVIPWNDDSDDCVGCGEILHVLNRKHHCRLCTGILCSSCSLFVPLEEAARALAKPVPESLGDHALRLCEKCQNVINRAREEVTAKSADHTMEQNYKTLSQARLKCDNLIDVYKKMSQSLRRGEAAYTLDEGNVKRVELIKQFKIVDVVSERISAMKTSSPAQIKVQVNIRQATRSYLQDNLPATTPLPELKEVKEMQVRRLEENKAAVLQQKHEALRSQTPPSLKVAPQPDYEPQPGRADSWSTKAKKVEISRDMARESRDPSRESRDPSRETTQAVGWTGETVAPQARSHPLIEQKEILRGYLRQAVRDNKPEEVETLKQNLHMILDEIKTLGLDDT